MIKKIILCLFLFFLINNIVYSRSDFRDRLSKEAINLTKNKVVYDGSYFVIDYPNGDVAKDKGVCTDVLIRAYRKLGIDLQKEVHEDMIKDFDKYPKLWNNKKPDKNIDHRRVQNLMLFFTKFRNK